MHVSIFAQEKGTKTERQGSTLAPVRRSQTGKNHCRASKFSWMAKFTGPTGPVKNYHPTFIFSVIRSRMLPPFISDAKDKHPTFIFSIIRSRMLPPFISEAKDKHPTFIFSVIRSRMLPPLISDAKDKHLTFIFSVIRSRMLPPFIFDAKDKHPTFILASYGAECYHH